MATHNDHHHQNNLVPEASGIKARPVLLFLGILAAASAVTFALIWGLLIAFNKMDEMTQPQRATELSVEQKAVPPEPRLQGAPGPDGLPSMLPERDLQEYNKQINERANGYGWVNREAGIASIPLEQARKIIEQRGLPAASAEMTRQIERAEQVRKQALKAQSNAGRIIGAQ
jgi:hypothetical protein